MKIVTKIYDDRTGEKIQESSYKLKIEGDKPEAFLSIDNFWNYVEKVGDEYQSLKVESIMIFKKRVEIWLLTKD